MISVSDKLSDPYHRLAVAILWLAICDTAPKDRNRRSAIHWLLTPDQSDWLLDYLEVTELARKWARRGCPRPLNNKLPRKNKVSDRDWSKYGRNVFDEITISEGVNK